MERRMIRDIIDSSKWYCNMSNLCWRRHYYRYKYDPTQTRSFIEFRLRTELSPEDLENVALSNGEYATTE